jgi:tetratricopeptide (TPR) repeat protein
VEGIIRRFEDLQGDRRRTISARRDSVWDAFETLLRMVDTNTPAVAVDAFAEVFHAWAPEDLRDRHRSLSWGHVLNGLGLSRMALSSLEFGMGTLREAVARGDARALCDEPWYHLEAGDALVDLEQPEAAAGAYDTARRLVVDGTDPFTEREALLRLSWAWAVLGRPERSFAFLEEVEEHLADVGVLPDIPAAPPRLGSGGPHLDAPKDHLVGWFQAHGDVLAFSGRHEEALAYFRRGLAYHHGRPEGEATDDASEGLLVGVARCNEALGNAEAADRAYRQAVRLLDHEACTESYWWQARARRVMTGLEWAEACQVRDATPRAAIERNLGILRRVNTRWALTDARDELVERHAALLARA